jgi:hypothetical protein
MKIRKYVRNLHKVGIDINLLIEYFYLEYNILRKKLHIFVKMQDFQTNLFNFSL